MSTEMLPPAPVPEGADLRGLARISVDSQFFQKILKMRANHSEMEFCVAVTLLLKSLYQVPAGSLPDDDEQLFQLSEVGRMKTWLKIKESVLQGWYRCADGRLYCDTVASEVSAMIAKREKYVERARKAGNKRWEKNRSAKNQGVVNGGGTVQNGGSTQSAEQQKSGMSVVRCPRDVDQRIWSDFLMLRKAKRAPLTETAVNWIRKEAERAGISLNDALSICCQRGWQGFKAEWVLKDAKHREMQPKVVEPDWSKIDYGGAGVELI